MQLTSLLPAGAGAKLTSCFSLEYLLFFLPISLLLFTVTPQSKKKYCLIAVSFIFYWLISGKLILYLWITAISMHYFGIWLDRIQRRMKEQLKETDKAERKAVKKGFVSRQRGVLTFAVLLQIGALLTIKYSGFFLGNVNTLFSLLHVSARFDIPSFLVPIGVSFFTLQAASYLFDVYRGVVPADESLPRLLLFISFFPQIVEGPICRYKQTAQALWDVQPIRFDNLKYGLVRIAFGMMKKLVVADRLNPFVTKAFSDYSATEGGVLALAAVLYTVQLYMDFSGSMDAVIGTAQIFGIELPENFRRPFFSKSVSEFWMRWHITLGAWFKDYVFYPLSTSTPLKKLTSSARKKIGNHYGPLLAGGIALFCVWLGNGVWHGVGWNFIFFGLYHFVLIYSGSLFEPLTRRLEKVLHIRPDRFVFRCLRIVRTSILVVIGELFFRAEGLHAGLAMFGRIVSQFSFRTLNDALLGDFGIDRYDLIITCVTVLIVFVIGLLQEKGVAVRDALFKKHVVIRWAILYALILFIVVFGAYGIGYTPVDPMYAQF